MTSFINKVFYFLMVLLQAWTLSSKAQTHSFSHLNTSNGLSENNVQSVAIDKNGFLWIGTIDGLNVYDGYSVTVYKKEDQPQMAANNVIHLTCDSRNRIWMGTWEGVSWVDEHRKIHRVVLEDSVEKFGCRTIADTKRYGPVIYTSLGQYYLDEKSGKWKKLDWVPKELAFDRFHDAEPFDEDRIIYATDSVVMILDYASGKAVYEQPLEAVFSLCRYSDHEIAIGQQHGKVQIADIRKHSVTREFQLTSELNKKKINATITEVRMAVNGSLLVATTHSGIVVIEKDGRITSYKHDPINPTSIGSNLTWRVLGGKNGDVIVGTGTAGVSIFNIYNKQAGYQAVFSDGKGDFYDSFVSKMAEDETGALWIGALEKLIYWNPKNNSTKFYYYYSLPIWTGAQSLELRAVCVDKRGRVWVSALGDGVAVFDKASAQFIRIRRDTSLGAAVRSDFVVELFTASDGTIWAGSTAGLYTIDPVSLKITSFRDHPLLKQLEGIRVSDFYEDALHNLWIATFNGIYYYDRKANRLSHYTEKEGLISNQCFTLLLDKKGTLFTTTSKGFSMISKDQVQSFGRSQGLRYDACEGVLQDDIGKVWISNSKCLIRFDPERKAMQFYDANSGFTTEGFRMGSFLKTKNGDMFWGSRSGINYFSPEELINHTTALRVNIYGVQSRDSILYFDKDQPFAIKYKDNAILFRFAAINLNGSHNIQYQYKLEGYDNEWQTGKDIREARYASLPAGLYTFRLKASQDGVSWTNAGNTVTLRIIPPLWQRWWFVALCTVLLACTIYYAVQYRQVRAALQKEELETEQAINYFASSLHEQQTVDSILWDVARNCIGRLKFEDCVVYLMDEKRKVLVQKAAYGPKSPRQFEISQPIEIPLGRGIVGSVASTGRGEIVEDTTKDPRYIMDDEQRYSEISVPIVSGGKILGVIDCEHSKKRFFTQKHLSILTTIASLCANKIVRALAEEEKQKAQSDLMDTQRKMAEVEMQALRAQMNPHFIFNCLNSINRYIVKSDQATASLYLTRFAKLIRLILDNSGSKNVTLSNELEALKLYIEMEALRFDKKFSYVLLVDRNISTDSIEVPPLIIQPFVENAIWHGLLHKDAGGQLLIQLRLVSESMLECVIEDNGVGRARAGELKSKSATSRKSLGMQLTKSRLALLNKHAELNASIHIIDLEDDKKKPAGTKVVLRIPV